MSSDYRLKCRQCSFRGGSLDALEHYDRTQHELEHHGLKQDMAGWSQRAAEARAVREQYRAALERGRDGAC